MGDSKPLVNHLPTYLHQVLHEEKVGEVVGKSKDGGKGEGIKTQKDELEINWTSQEKSQDRPNM